MIGLIYARCTLQVSISMSYSVTDECSTFSLTFRVTILCSSIASRCDDIFLAPNLFAQVPLQVVCVFSGIDAAVESCLTPSVLWHGTLVHHRTWHLPKSHTILLISCSVRLVVFKRGQPTHPTTTGLALCNVTSVSKLANTIIEKQFLVKFSCLHFFSILLAYADHVCDVLLDRVRTVDVAGTGQKFPL